MKLAIMQPYFFPYVGYFQLVNAVDKLVFYDDVNFIKGGWINRNRILVNGKASYFNIQMNAASSYKKIKDITVNTKNIHKTLKTLKQAYIKAPYFNDFFPILEEYFIRINSGERLSEVAGNSIELITNYLNVDTVFEYSSKKYGNTKESSRLDRLIDICKMNDTTNYINLSGGKNLYAKSDFDVYGINLSFISSNDILYSQYNTVKFEPWLSIIDVIMFNGKNKTMSFLKNYKME